MPSPTYRSNADRWAADATGRVRGEVILVGMRLIDQAELDARHRDYRLRDILGQNWWANMIRMGSSNPGRTEQLWRHLITDRYSAGIVEVHPGCTAGENVRFCPWHCAISFLSAWNVLAMDVIMPIRPNKHKSSNCTLIYRRGRP